MIEHFFSTATILLVAMLIEDRIGYPDALYRRVGHPVTWIGALIAACDKHLNRPALSFTTRRLLGIVALLLFAGTAILLAIALSALLQAVLPTVAAYGLIGSRHPA